MTRKVLVVALVALPLLLALSYPWRDAHHGPGYVASLVGWLGFLTAALVVVGCAVTMAVGRLRRA